MGVALVLAAGGGGSRFGGGVPKQYRPLCGRPVFLWSLAAFDGLVEVVVIVAALEHHALVMALAAAEGRAVQVVAGGPTRQSSVHAGLLAVPASCDRVLVHDAARPLVPPAAISACIAALAAHDGAVVAVPCASTVKRVAGTAVTATVPRSDLWLAQTPQGLRREVALDCFARAAAEGWDCTDDVQVLERAGRTVAVVPGEAANLKITTPDDWLVAEALLAARCAPPA